MADELKSDAGNTPSTTLSARVALHAMAVEVEIRVRRPCDASYVQHFHASAQTARRAAADLLDAADRLDAASEAKRKALGRGADYVAAHSKAHRAGLVPNPVGVIAPGQSLGSRTVELCMARTDALAGLAGLEGRIVAVCAGPRPLGHGGFVRTGAPVRVLGVHAGEKVEVLLSAPLPTLVPAVCHGDALYLASDVAEWAEQDEWREVEAWKAERRQGNG